MSDSGGMRVSVWVLFFWRRRRHEGSRCRVLKQGSSSDIFDLLVVGEGGVRGYGIGGRGKGGRGTILHWRAWARRGGGSIAFAGVGKGGGGRCRDFCFAKCWSSEVGMSVLTILFSPSSCPLPLTK